MKPGQWDEMKKRNGWNDVEMRDNRYNQVIHMVSAAKGAEAFYQTDTHVRHENLDLARQLDDFSSQVCAHGDVTWKTVTSLLAICEGNPLVTGGFPSQRASSA